MTHETFLMGEYGSRAMGTDNEFSDNDYMGVAVESKDFVIGLNSWEQDQIKTALPGQRSGHGDVDQTIYSLRKWARLAAKGNPTVLSLLYLPEYIVISELGQKLIDNRDIFLSKEAGFRHLGYMTSQRDAMTGMRNKRTNRPELIHQFGFDTKFAGHLIRLGIQGVELMNEHEVNIPMSPANRIDIQMVREGKVTKEEVLDWADVLKDRLEHAIEYSSLPERTDTDRINSLIIDLQEDYWRAGTIF